jgi:exodeoxyribonuclease VII large subunit
MDLIDEPGAGDNAPEFSVSELSGAVKRLVEGEFGHVRVRGELGRVVLARSGHVYLDLKDDRSVLAAVIWKGQAARMQVRPEEGMEVVATGRLTTFPGQSKYQLVIEDLAPAGVGALMAMLEKRRKALAAEGLFDAARKRPIPFLPDVIGVVTSPQGAVIRDILHRLRDRFARRVVVWPVAVQGDRCAPQVAAAVTGFNAMPAAGPVPRPDVIIVARGGGSIEDLWGFNDEAVVRAVAASAIPVISAVGHETDTTLIDFAADIRAPTPTAAAELAVPVRSDLIGQIGDLGARMRRAGLSGLTRRADRLRDLGRLLPRPGDLIAARTQTLDYLAGRLPGALRARVQGAELRLGRAAARLRLPRSVDAAALRLGRAGDRLTAALPRRIGQASDALGRIGTRLRPGLAARTVAQSGERFAGVRRRFANAARTQVLGWQTRLSALERLRQTLGYRATLKRGYAVVRGPGDGVLTAVAAAGSAGTGTVEFADGRIAARFDPVREAKPKRQPRDQGDDPGQGSLF